MMPFPSFGAMLKEIPLSDFILHDIKINATEAEIKSDFMKMSFYFCLNLIPLLQLTVQK